MSDEVPDKPTIVRALIGAGFTLTDGNYPHPNYQVFRAARTEIFGGKAQHTIVVACRPLSCADVNWLVKDASRDGSVLTLIGNIESAPQEISVLSYSQFFDRLGGPIFSLLPFAPEYKSRLLFLGNNKVPPDLTGKADDLFEQYVHAGLQFLFHSRVIRYGQERLFETVPDGIALGRAIPLMLYDAKAAGGGYEMSMEAVRQFADYADEFHKAYETIFGRLNCFLVISGEFKDDEDALADRSYAVKARCGVPLTFLTAETLGSMTDLLAQEPIYRRTIDWHLVFARPVVRFRDVEKQLQARAKDRLLAPLKG